MWALSALSIAQLMLLSLWVGMGGSNWIVRLVGALGGTTYVTIWPELAPYISPDITVHQLPLTSKFLDMFAAYAALVLLLSGSFVMLQRRGTKLAHVSRIAAQASPPRIQYSMFHLLLLMSICSLVLSLVKTTQTAEQDTTGFSMLAFVAGYILILVVFLINNLLCRLGGIELKFTLVTHCTHDWYFVRARSCACYCHR